MESLNHIYCQEAIKFFKSLDTEYDPNNDILAKYNNITKQGANQNTKQIKTNSNRYLLDKFGLVIRKNDANKQLPTGYTKNENDEYVNINIDKTLLQFEPKKVLYDTLDRLYKNTKFPKNGIVSKIYKELYPEYFSKK